MNLIGSLTNRRATGPGVLGFPFERQTQSVDTSSQLVSLSNLRMLLRFRGFYEHLRRQNPPATYSTRISPG